MADTVTFWLCIFERVKHLQSFYDMALVCKASAQAARKLRDQISDKFAKRDATYNGGWQTYLPNTKRELLHGTMGLYDPILAKHRILNFRFGRLEQEMKEKGEK